MGYARGPVIGRIQTNGHSDWPAKVPNDRSVNLTTRYKVATWFLTKGPRNRLHATQQAPVQGPPLRAHGLQWWPATMRRQWWPSPDGVGAGPQSGLGAARQLPGGCRVQPPPCSRRSRRVSRVSRVQERRV
jgi:hypothetical protein